MLRRSSPGVLLLTMCATTGCGDSPRIVADARDSPAAVAPPPPKPKVWEPKPVVAPPDTIASAHSDSGAADSLAGSRDTSIAKTDSVPPRSRARGPRPFILSPADSAKWPVTGRRAASRLDPAGESHRRLLRQSAQHPHGYPRPGAARLDAPAAGEGGDAVGAGRPGAGRDAGAPSHRDGGAGEAGRGEQVSPADGAGHDRHGGVVGGGARVDRVPRHPDRAQHGGGGDRAAAAVSPAALRAPRARSRVRHEAGRRARQAGRHAGRHRT